MPVRTLLSERVRSQGPLFIVLLWMSGWPGALAAKMARPAVDRGVLDAIVTLAARGSRDGVAPRFTPGCIALVAAAARAAARRNHAQVSTEHFVYALFTDDACKTSHSYNYLVHMAGVDPAAVIARTEALPGFAPCASAVATPPFLSTRLTEAAVLAGEVHSAVVAAGGEFDLCSEHFIAAILLCPRCLGARVLESACERVSAAEFLGALGIDTASFRERVVAARAGFAAHCPWKVGPAADAGGEGVGAAGAAAEVTAVPDVSHDAPAAGDAVPSTLPEVVRDRFERMRGPTAESNWLVPGCVLTGAHPSYDGDGTRVACRIVDHANVDTFVCFTEWEPDYVNARMTTRNGRHVRYVWFPIDDFGVTSPADTALLVEELARMVHDGHILYMHCLSGRGRTGTVAIPLLMALYPHLPESEARQLANEYKRHGRSGHTRGGHMPEVSEQRAQVAAGEAAYKRGGGRAAMKT